MKHDGCMGVECECGLPCECPVPQESAARTLPTTELGRMNQIAMLNEFGRSHISAVRILCFI